MDFYWINIVCTAIHVHHGICLDKLCVSVYVCVSVSAQSVIKTGDSFPSTVRCFLHRSEIATGLWEELGDQVGWDGVGMTAVLWVCSLTGGWHLMDNITFPHAGTSPPAKPPPTHPPVQPCLHRILTGSELHHGGLSNQTTHAKANG